MDVDFFSVTVSPATLLRIHPAGCYVSLVAMAPESRDLNKYKSWVFFAESKCRLAFEPQFKLPLIERLGQAPQHATLLATPHARTLSYGTLRLDTAVVVEALQDIGCQSVRVSAYGIKVPIDTLLIQQRWRHIRCRTPTSTHWTYHLHRKIDRHCAQVPQRTVQAVSNCYAGGTWL